MERPKVVVNVRFEDQSCTGGVHVEEKFEFELVDSRILVRPLGLSHPQRARLSSPRRHYKDEKEDSASRLRDPPSREKSLRFYDVKKEGKPHHPLGEEEYPGRSRRKDRPLGRSTSESNDKRRPEVVKPKHHAEKPQKREGPKAESEPLPIRRSREVKREQKRGKEKDWLRREESQHSPKRGQKVNPAKRLDISPTRSNKDVHKTGGKSRLQGHTQSSEGIRKRSPQDKERNILRNETKGKAELPLFKAEISTWSIVRTYEDGNAVAEKRGRNEFPREESELENAWFGKQMHLKSKHPKFRSEESVSDGIPEEIDSEDCIEIKIHPEDCHEFHACIDDERTRGKERFHKERDKGWVRAKSEEEYDKTDHDKEYQVEKTRKKEVVESRDRIEESLKVEYLDRRDSAALRQSDQDLLDRLACRLYERRLQMKVILAFKNLLQKKRERERDKFEQLSRYSGNFYDHEETDSTGSGLREVYDEQEEEMDDFAVQNPEISRNIKADEYDDVKEKSRKFPPCVFRCCQKQTRWYTRKIGEEGLEDKMEEYEQTDSESEIEEKDYNLDGKDKSTVTLYSMKIRADEDDKM